MEGLSKERLEVLLYNALTAIEDNSGIETLIGTDIEEEIGITQEEYDMIMGTGK